MLEDVNRRTKGVVLKGQRWHWNSTTTKIAADAACNFEDNYGRNGAVLALERFRSL
jgi:hypothetical protein